MGCGGSTPLPSEEEAPVIEVPGWNGVVYPQKSERVKIIRKQSGNMATMTHTTTADMADVNAQIAAESTAGAGFRFVGWNYPVGSVIGAGDTLQPRDFKRPTEFSIHAEEEVETFAMMVFQQVDMPASPLETKTVSSEMTRISKSYSQNSGAEKGNIIETSSSYDELFSKLKLLGDEGYSLSAVIDEPDAKQSLSGYDRVTKSTVTLVGQRVAGTAPRATTYTVQDVPIQIGQPSFTCLTATMPTLNATLEEYFGPKRCKLAAVYNPPTVVTKSLMPFPKHLADNACHLIFEATDEPYAVHVVDVVLFSVASNTHAGVQHASYLTVIENFVAKGWELGAVISMPDHGAKGLFKSWSTVKLLFQAKSNQPGLVHAPEPVPAATTQTS